MTEPSLQPRFVAVGIEGPVAEVSWSRPERKNAIGKDVCAELTRALVALATRPEIAVVVFRSVGQPFCAGWDVRDFEEIDMAAPGAARSFFAPGRTLLGSITAMPQITIAAPGGATLGFGCSLLARCDMVVAADDAYFALPEIRRGMPPATVLPELLAVMPCREALAWAVTGDRMTATDALRNGLVTSVVSSQVHDGHVRDLARRIAGFGPELIHETKLLVRRIGEAPPEKRIQVGVDSAIDRMRRNSADSRS